MLYSIDLLEPLAAEKNMIAGVTVPKKVFEGMYTLTGRHLTVEVSSSEWKMRFSFRF